MQKEITYWSPYSLWQRCTLTYEPLQKGGIEPSEHPAVQEDEWLALTPSVGRHHQRRHGELVAIIATYLRKSGPAMITEIAMDLGVDKLHLISMALRRHPETFDLIGHKAIGDGSFVSKAAIWDVKEGEFPLGNRG